MGVQQLDQHVQHLSKGAGVCEEELPWVALPVRKKIGYLKKERQTADKLFRDGHQAAYEKEAKYLYGMLREAWERALEEVLLGGIVERFRPGVQTQHIAIVADIDLHPCRDAFLGLAKTCANLGIAFWDYLGARLDAPNAPAVPSRLEVAVAGRLSLAATVGLLEIGRIARRIVRLALFLAERLGLPRCRDVGRRRAEELGGGRAESGSERRKG
jgi:hypothetical protein